MEQNGKLKWCELCMLPARVYCAADEASLCWHCDAQVHAANFLVARHFRALLCHACGAPTEWMKTGCRIDPKLPFCQHCFCETNRKGELDRDDEESKIAPSASCSTSFFSSGDSEECVARTRATVRAAPQTDIVKKAGSAKSKRLRSDRPCIESGRENAHQRLGFVKQANDTYPSRPEISGKEYSTVETVDGTRCESNVLQFSSFGGRATPATKRFRRTLSEGVGDSEDGQSGATTSCSSQVDSTGEVFRYRTSKKQERSPSRGSALATATQEFLFALGSMNQGRGQAAH